MFNLQQEELEAVLFETLVAFVAFVESDGIVVFVEFDGIAAFVALVGIELFGQ